MITDWLPARVFVDDDREVGALLLEEVERLGERERVGDRDDGLHDAGLADREGLAVGVELEELLPVDDAQNVVDVAVDDEKLVVGRERDLLADALVTLVEAEVDDAVAGRHGAGYQMVFKAHHVRDGGMLKRRDDARLGARLDRRDYVLVGDLVLVVERHAHHAHDRVGEHRQEPDERLEEHDERHHRTDAAHGHLFGAAHGDALRNEVREHHEENRDEHTP